MVNLRLSRAFFEDRLNIYLGVRNALNNINVLDSSNGNSQEEYYGLYDGTTAYIGSRYTF